MNWQPIETVPHGVLVLVWMEPNPSYGSSHGSVHVARIRGKRWCCFQPGMILNYNPSFWAEFTLPPGVEEDE